MGSRVPSKIGHLNELFLAVIACERFFARVQANVRLQMMVASEALAAFRTSKGFFAGVRSFVIL